MVSLALLFFHVVEALNPTKECQKCSTIQDDVRELWENMT